MRLKPGGCSGESDNVHLNAQRHGGATTRGASITVHIKRSMSLAEEEAKGRVKMESGWPPAFR